MDTIFFIQKLSEIKSFGFIWDHRNYSFNNEVSPDTKFCFPTQKQGILFLNIATRNSLGPSLVVFLGTKDCDQ